MLHIGRLSAIGVLVVVALAFPAHAAPALAGTTLLFDDFRQRPEGLITNEYAFHHPTDPAARKDAIWELTSGSFFERHVNGFTGHPDHISPNALSSNGNNSAVFRARTHRADFTDVVVDFDLRNMGFLTTTGVPPHSYDGMGVWLRHVSEYELYEVTVNRRDNTVVIKKKMPGGRSNGGTYYDLGSAQYAARINATIHVAASIQTQHDASVIVRLTIDGKAILRVRDDGRSGSPPILGKGRVGLRGDNCEFYVRNFRVTANPAP
jgi:hypothetical protein